MIWLRQRQFSNAFLQGLLEINFLSLGSLFSVANPLLKVIFFQLISSFSFVLFLVIVQLSIVISSFTFLSSRSANRSHKYRQWAWKETFFVCCSYCTVSDLECLLPLFKAHSQWEKSIKLLLSQIWILTKASSLNASRAHTLSSTIARYAQPIAMQRSLSTPAPVKHYWILICHLNSNRESKSQEQHALNWAGKFHPL